MTVRVRAEMPEQDPRPPRGRGWWIGVLGLVALLIWCGLEMALHARFPSGYRGRHWEGPWPYPTDEVRTWMGAMLGEGGLAVGVLALRTTFSIGMRAFLLCASMLCATAFFGALAMHADSTFAWHVIWLFFATCWLAVFTIGEIIASLWIHRSSR